MTKPAVCELCHQSLKDDDEDDDSISTEMNTPKCVSCNCYYCFCETCENACQFLGVEVEPRDVFRIFHRNQAAKLVPWRYFADDPLFLGGGGGYNEFPVLHFEHRQVNYVSCHEIEFLTGEKITGASGGLFTFWWCHRCNKKFSLTDK